MGNRERRVFLKEVGLAGLASVLWPAAGWAQLGSRPAADWIRTLERPERVTGLRIPEVIARLGLRPGMRVADIGAGPGVFTLQFASAVAPGTAYAVEVDQALLDHIGQRAREQQLTNVRLVLGKFEDPALPDGNIDLAFFHDVLHHIAERQTYLKNLARYLGPTGRVVIIERAEGREGEMHLTTAQVSAMMAEAGFPSAQAVALFPDKSFVIYSR